MISYADVERLLSVRAPAARVPAAQAERPVGGQPGLGRAQPSVLSLYLGVPADPAELRGLTARAHGLIALAAGGPADEEEASRLIDSHGRDWLGQTAAIFVAAQDSWRSEAFSLPCQLPDRAVLAQRPHVRPLLVALQRCPAHYVAVVDSLQAWLLRVQADQVIELERDHFRTTIALLERVMQPGGQEPVVVGGQAEAIGPFTAMLPSGLRDRVAGSFVADPDTMTPAMAGNLARPIIDDWVSMREKWLAVQTRLGDGPYEPLVVSGLNRCLDAVNQHAVQLLIVPVSGIAGGYICNRCGALSSTGTDCPDGQQLSRWVPDLFEEMVTRTLDDGGQVEALADPPGQVAAQLRFSVTEVNGR
jgi:hypothetical protein